jgi:hypothetical protein
VPIAFLPFDGWTPSGSYFGEGWVTATNLYPAYASWRPWRRLIPETNNVGDGPMLGGHVHVWNSGIGTSAYRPDGQTIFAGSSRRLYTVDPATGIFTDVSKAALYGPDFAGWRFASVGNDIFATNWIDPVQRRTNNAGLFADAFTSAFRPCPRFIAPIRGYLVGWNLSNAGRRQDELVWSDLDNAINFDPPATTSTSLAGSIVLPSIPGQGTGLVGGQYGLAFKRNATFYLEYAGPPQIFRPDVLDDAVGTAYPSSIIKSRYGVFFLGPDGFYKISGLSQPVKFSPPGIDQVLLDSNLTVNTLGTYYVWQEDTQIEGFEMTGWPMIGWAFRVNLGEHGNNVAVLYNPVTDQWSKVDLADPDPAEGLSPRPTVIFRRPYADTLYETLAGFTWNGGESRYASLSPSGAAANVFAPTATTRYRPANFATESEPRASEMGQSRIKGVLPLFSKLSRAGAALTPTVTVTPLLDPYGSPGTPEVRPAAERSDIAGWYPFQAAGRLFEISIGCAAEDFANLEGVYVDQELLT